MMLILMMITMIVMCFLDPKGHHQHQGGRISYDIDDDNDCDHDDDNNDDDDDIDVFNKSFFCRIMIGDASLE